MTSVCFYFQVHQPWRLRRYSVFDTDRHYFDDARNAAILRKVADRCYLPATELVLKLVREHEGRFRVAYSLTGCVLEQFQLYCPKMLDLLRELADTGCVEFLAETSHHSLAYLHSRCEFLAQVDLHATLLATLLGQTPRVFRHTELVYDNTLADAIAELGRYDAILTEGVDRLLAGRTTHHVYWPAGRRDVKLLLKHARLSDDIAFRFSDRQWNQWPLSADKFTQWVSRTDGPLCNLFMDYETFGEHQWRESGIFDFLAALPGSLLEAGHRFVTPFEGLALAEPVGEYDVPSPISWADTERDVSAWLGNAMQVGAAEALYGLEQGVRSAGDESLLRDWRRLTTSDHFYYMCTKYFADGDVHKYFNPYASPYDAYINFMNVLDSLRGRLEGG